jgi:hypothetical protein
MDAERKNHLLENPQDVLAKEFSFALLDQIFKRHRGYGGGRHELEIGGVAFIKHIKPVFSNSMKSNDFMIVIEGGGHRFTKASKYASNKRNKGRNLMKGRW